MVAIASRSLLDPIPPRGNLGITRDLLGVDRAIHPGHDVDGDGPGTLRHYRAAMIRQYGTAPTLGEIVSAGVGVNTCWDDGTQRRLLDTLARTMVGYSGTAGGFTLPLGLANDVIDRARQVVGPWSLCNWWRVKTREFAWPATAEASMASGSRYGGITSVWGLGETTMPTASDGQLNRIDFTQQRLLIYSQISRDLFSDSEMLDRWLSYVAVAEFRSAIEAAMINGPGAPVGSTVCPQGVINSPSTVVVSKGATSSGQISATNIDLQWSAIAAGNRQNAVWHANTATIDAIDQLAVSGQWPESTYIAAGISPHWPWATIKGRPLIPSPYCPNIGAPGDLIAVDWSDYVFTYLQMRPNDSPLSFVVDIPRDGFHRGLVGMPDDAAEMRRSDEKYFDTDVVAFGWKLRGDGKFIWAGTSKDLNGNTVGPAAIIAAR